MVLSLPGVPDVHALDGRRFCPLYGHSSDFEKASIQLGIGQTSASGTRPVPN
jgi:hypothetical protein